MAARISREKERDRGRRQELDPDCQESAWRQASRLSENDTERKRKQLQTRGERRKLDLRLFFRLTSESERRREKGLLSPANRQREAAAIFLSHSQVSFPSSDRREAAISSRIPRTSLSDTRGERQQHGNRTDSLSCAHHRQPLRLQQLLQHVMPAAVTCERLSLSLGVCVTD